MLGYFDNSPRHIGIRSPQRQSCPPVAGKSGASQLRHLNAIAAREWNELPYIMMRLTAANRRWDDKSLYWQDRTVQLGDIDLDLTKVWVNDRSPSYIARFRINETRRAVTTHPSPMAGPTHREFALHPSLVGDQVSWSSTCISESLNLSTDQLAQRLLGKLVTFYTRGVA